jgi:hypothetical protein
MNVSFMQPFLVALCGLVLSNSALAAAELSMENATVSSGERTTVAIRLKANGASVTALQFDVEYDVNALDLNGQVGTAGASASKQLKQSDLEKKGKRFILFGLNHNIVPDGAVIVLALQRKSGVTGKSYPMRLKAALATDAAADSVPLKVANQEMVVNFAE